MANNFNGMQANVGLIPGSAPAPTVLTPAQAAAQASQQASMQLQQAQAQLAVAHGGGASFSFGQQFQQQMQQIQQHQSLSIQQAAVMAGMMPGASTYAPGSIPSPISMTPPSTGVFRPPTPMGAMAPIPPMQPMPMIQTPLTPQLPQPMFRPVWEQGIAQREMMDDRRFSMSAQIPGAVGHGVGLGIGAAAGAAIGGRFGGIGRFVGGAIGAGAAQMSGFAGTMGGMGEALGRPRVEQHLMGTSIQSMSKDWVTGGPQLHEMGQGLSRSASMDLAGRVQSMAGSESFRRETGGQFNRHDLMNIMGQAGGSGLMDQSQDVEKIQDNLRKVSRTVRKFMQLTNDPDVTSVIREMSQMHALGMSVEDIDMAAGSMRSYARAAGMTTKQSMRTHGAMGAQTYQAAGLSPSAGMMYGMQAGAVARQNVSSGVYSPRQMGMLGGVQGIAQRDMQTNAAMMSMPMMGAAMGSYGAGGWSVDYDNLASMATGQGGASGLVSGAVRNMGAAVQRGGVGALAMFPLQQRQMQAEAAEAMSPYQQNAMRFQSAAATGRSLGLTGAGGFAAGAQAMFGAQAAEQMMIQASSPQYWKDQTDIVRREQNDLALRQRQDIKDSAPGGWELFKKRTGAGQYLSDMGGAVSAAGRSLVKPVKDLFERHQDFAREMEDRDRGVINYKTAKSFKASTREQEASLVSKGARMSTTARGQELADRYTSGGDYGTEGSYGGGFGGAVAAAGTAWIAGLEDPSVASQAYGDWRTERGGKGGLTDVAVGIAGKLGSLVGADTNYVRAFAGANAMLSLNDQERSSMISNANKIRGRQARIWQQSRSIQTSGKGALAQYDKLAKSIGSDQEQAQAIMMNAASKFAAKAAASVGLIADDPLTPDDARDVFIEAIAEAQYNGDIKKATADYDNMTKEQQDALVASTIKNGEIIAAPEGKERISDAMAETMGEYRGSIGKNRKARITKMQDDLKSYETAFFDIEEGMTGYTEFQDFVKGATKAEGYAVSATVTSGKQKAGLRAAAKKEFLAAQERGEYEDEDFVGFMERMRDPELSIGGMSKASLGKAREVLREGYASKKMQIMGGAQQYGAVSDLMTVGAFEGSVGRGAEELSTHIGINAGSFGMKELGGLTEKQLAKISGVGRFAGMSETVTEAQRLGVDTEEGREKMLSAYAQLAQAGQDLEGDQALVGATGKESDRLRAAEGAVGIAQEQMAEAFKNFTPTSTAKFAAGAERLYLAMNSATMRKLLKG